jgi:DNA-binding HxlR family transcriptional regulator
MIPRSVLTMIGDRWTVPVLSALGGGVARYSEIHRRIPAVSQKMLTQTLRALVLNQLVTRTVYAEVPPRVEYRLSAHGRSLMAALSALELWASMDDHEIAPTQVRRSA